MLKNLSSREMTCLVAAANGLRNQEIADDLGISIETVKTHLKRVYSKLEARDRAHSVAIAFRTGLLSG